MDSDRVGGFYFMDRPVAGKVLELKGSLGQRVFLCTKCNLIRFCHPFLERRSPTFGACLTRQQNLRVLSFLMSAIPWRGRGQKEMMSGRLTESPMHFSDFWKVIGVRDRLSQQRIWI